MAEREWYVYSPQDRLVLSGYATQREAEEEAYRAAKELFPSLLSGKQLKALPRTAPEIKHYAETHPAFAESEGFVEVIKGVRAIGIDTKIIHGGVPFNRFKVDLFVPQAVDFEQALKRAKTVSEINEVILDAPSRTTATDGKFRIDISGSLSCIVKTRADGRRVLECKEED